MKKPVLGGRNDQLFKMLLLGEVRRGLAAGFSLMEATSPCQKSSFSGALGMKAGVQRRMRGEWQDNKYRQTS